MSHEPSLPIVVTDAPAMPAAGHESPRPTVFCNLTDDQVFMPQSLTRAYAPVLANFGAGQMHLCTWHGSWELERAVSEQGAALFRSVLWCTDGGDKPSVWDDLTFRFGPRAFLYADDTKLMGYAATPQEAEEMVRKFGAAYRKPPAPARGVFCLIKGGKEISSESVPLDAATMLTEEKFHLHYGAEGWAWHQDYTAKLSASPHGLTILEGPPGTGKTSYLRHLMGVLRDTHRFYFVPPATVHVLSSPDFVGFWAEQRRFHKDFRFVVILEDADGALMTRESDNRAHVSAILNLSDGMLADFLRLQIVCTINGSAAGIDPALRRPGRLLCHRVFPRLDPAQAARLAASLGRKLPDGRHYSLAEIFSDNHAEPTRPYIGFAA